MKIQRFLLLCLLVNASLLNGWSQNRCGTDALAVDRAARFPNSQSGQTRPGAIQHGNPDLARGGGGPRVIPVVVHLIQQSSFPAISDARVQSQIDVLNEDFGLYNADTNLIPTEFLAVAANCNIRFCLASIDPNGCPTNGINRIVEPSLADHDMNDEALLKGRIQWDPHRFLNMWVPVTIKDGILGYATFPDWMGWDPGRDGVVINGTSFGRGFGTPAGSYNQGRTATHEVGHWLGLYHTFEGGCSGTTQQNCASQGDRVCDTPPTSSANYGCPGVRNSCLETPIDHNDQTMNYMDYTDDRCMQMFTWGQMARIDSYLASDRDLIWSAPNLAVTGCDGTQSPGCQPVCAFDADMESVCAGQSIQFQDLSSGPATSWNWTFVGGNPASATIPNPLVTYNSPGTYPVTLVVTNVAGSDTLTSTVMVSSPSSSPISESFEVLTGFPVGWSETSQSADYGWEPTAAAASHGSRAVVAPNFLQSAPGLHQDLLSPPYALALGASLLTFDHAYKRRTGFGNDSLQVWASTDCGVTWQKIWEKGAFALVTTGGFQAVSAFVPTASQWRSDTVDLSAFAGAPNFRIKFRAVGGNSQNLYLDHINMQMLVGANPAQTLQGLVQVHPNPSSSAPTIRFQAPKPGRFWARLYDLQGRTAYEWAPRASAGEVTELAIPTYEWGMLPSGLYHLKVYTVDGVTGAKIVKTN